jgi:hypothetical protein
VEQLQGELDTSKKVIARLEGKASELPVQEPQHSRALGVPLEWRLERTLPYELGDEGYEAMAALLRARLPGGKASQVGRTLTYDLPLAEVKVARDSAGKTVVALRGFTPTRASGLGVVTGMLTFLSLVVVGGVLAGLGQHPSNILWAFPLTIAVVAPGAWKALRGSARRAIERQRQEQIGAFEALLAVAEQHAPSRQLRIDPVPDEQAALPPAEAEPAAAEAAPEDRVIRTGGKA